MNITSKKVVASVLLLAILGIVPAFALAPPAPTVEIQQTASRCAGELTPIWVSWDFIPTADRYEFYLVVNGVVTVSGSGGVLGFGTEVITPSDVTAFVRACNDADECSAPSSKTIWVKAIAGCMPR